MKPRYHSEGESFVIESYNEAPPFSNFFPALAGVTGKPFCSSLSHSCVGCRNDGDCSMASSGA